MGIVAGGGAHRRLRALHGVRARRPRGRRAGRRSQLAATTDATTVRIRDAQVAVTDGPYAEAKEALGGYYLLECPSLDEAVAWAARIPGAEHGAIEVRAVHVDPEEG